MKEYFEANKRHWDELVPIHEASTYYDVDAFRAGQTSLHPLEIAELGDVAGMTLLHLQCHFGLDTLSWARRGATVTGADFSPAAITAARALTTELGIAAEFVESDVYSLPGAVSGQFDIVYTSYGTYFWLPDLARWAGVIAYFLAPGGTFYMADFHPILVIFDDVTSEEDELRVRRSYFAGAEPLRFEEDGSYADREAELANRTTYSWPHSLGEMVSALTAAGLRIEFLHEFDYTVEQWFPFMDLGPDGMWRLTKHHGSLPLLFSVRATKPA